MGRVDWGSASLYPRSRFRDELSCRSRMKYAAMPARAKGREYIDIVLGKKLYLTCGGREPGQRKVNIRLAMAH